MQKILIFLILVSTFCLGQDVKYLSPNDEFKNGETAYLFGDDVKLRSEPSTNSEVLILLEIGTEITILEKTSQTLYFEGIDSPWYKVKFKEKTGYVLGGLISLDRQSFNNYIYLSAFKKEGEKLYLKTRLVSSTNEYVENISELDTSVVTLHASGNKGIANVESIFLIDYMAEACGVNGGGIYLFYDGKNLIKAIDFTQIGDADLYSFIENYTFPDDKDGIAGKIVYTREHYEKKDDETEWTETTVNQRQLEWKNNQMLPKIIAKDY